MVGDAPSPTADGVALLRAIPGWRVVDDRTGGTAAERLDRDRQLLEAVRAGHAPPTARLWENSQCVVAARSERNLPGLEAARAQLAPHGWPVLVRDSGGTAVPHAPGILHLSLAFRPPERPLCTLDSVYAALALPLQRGLARIGVAAEFGDVPGSFCDGRFNLVTRGRKLAGTAQRWRARPGAASPSRGAVLAHALLLVSGDVTEWTRTINAFYAEAGSARRYEPAASITVAECVGESGPPLVEKIRAILLEELSTLLA
ncbi:MAG: hypothetical protein OEP95_12565 [Myxococcales bacterium]|nr:hypothetical protein [Myxococcales bacterium]